MRCCWRLSGCNPIPNNYKVSSTNEGNGIDVRYSEVVSSKLVCRGHCIIAVEGLELKNMSPSIDFVQIVRRDFGGGYRPM